MKNTNNKIYIPSSVLSKIDIKSLAIYIKARRLYRNRIFYNYTPERLSTNLGCSVYRARLAMRDLKKAGLFTKLTCGVNKKDHVLFSTLKSFQEKYKEDKRDYSLSIDVNRFDSVDVIIDKIRFAIIKQNIIDRQQYRIRGYVALHNVDNKKIPIEERQEMYKFLCSWRRSLKRRGLGLEDLENVDDRITVGYRRISELIGISIASVRDFLTRMIRTGYLDGFKPLVKRYMFTHEHAFKYRSEFVTKDKNTPCHQYICNGYLYQHYGTELELRGRHKVVR